MTAGTRRATRGLGDSFTPSGRRPQRRVQGGRRAAKSVQGAPLGRRVHQRRPEDVPAQTLEAGAVALFEAHPCVQAEPREAPAPRGNLQLLPPEHLHARLPARSPRAAYPRSEVWEITAWTSSLSSSTPSSLAPKRGSASIPARAWTLL